MLFRSGNTTYNENDTDDHGAETNGGTSYRPGTGVDIYKKATGYIVGYNQAGEWLEYTVKVASTGTYTMNASVASANSTSSFKLSMDGRTLPKKLLCLQQPLAKTTTTNTTRSRPKWI